MEEKLLISKEEFLEILNEEKKSFINEIEAIKLSLVERLCKKNFVNVDLENFFKLFPKEYLRVIKGVFERDEGIINLKASLLAKLKKANFFEDFREKAKELEEYFAFEYLENNVDYLLNLAKDYYSGKMNSFDASFFLGKIEGLYGGDLIKVKTNEFIRKIQYKVCISEIKEIYNKFEKNLKENFYKIKDKIEIPPLLILQMGINSLNKRYPHLFENLNIEDEKKLKAEFLKLKERGFLLCWLYSLSKFYIDEGIKNENPESFLKELNEDKLKNFYNKFLMGIDIQLEIKLDDLDIFRKAYIFKKIIVDDDYKILELAEEFYEDDNVFLKICKDEIFKKYENFAKEEILPFIEKNKKSIAIFRNLVFSADYFSHTEILPFYKMKKNFIPFLEKEEIKKPFEDFENKIILNIKEKILKLKQDFSKISIEKFKEEALKILEEIANLVLFWEDFQLLLLEFSREFLHLHQLPEEVIDVFGRISFNYLSALLNETNFLDLPEDAKPQITLFETVNQAKEKGKIIELSEVLKKPISYDDWEEVLFEYKLSTPYRDFYKYIKNHLSSKSSHLLLKTIIEVLQKEDWDLSISQNIFQDLSFLPEIKENEIFNLLLEEKNFQLYKNELKEKIFGIYPYFDEDLKKIVNRKGFSAELFEIEYTKKEGAFLNFLKEIKAEKSIFSFNNYLKIAKFPYLKEEKGKWEEFFIPVKHYLIQIEQSNDGFSIKLNISGKREGPHPFEGQLLKFYNTKDKNEISWALTLFQKYISFLLDLEEELFIYEYLEPKKKQKYVLKTKKIEKVISFKRKDGKFMLKKGLERQILKKLWAKAYGPFYANEKDESDVEIDLRILLTTLKSVLL